MALKHIEYKCTNFDIAYDIINASNSKVIVFLHGWGSNKELMKTAFSNEFATFKHIYIDMPGFGKSENNSLVLNTSDYANIVDEFLKKLKIDEDILIIGHSFGGKVATLLNPKYLVLLSSAGVVEPKSLEVKLKIKFAKILNFLKLRNITKLFRSKDVRHMNQFMYETFKNVVDEDFTKNFENFSNKAFIFWGKEDNATSFQSGKKIASLIKNNQFIPYSGDHYFFIKHSSNIAKRVENGIL